MTQKSLQWTLHSFPSEQNFFFYMFILYCFLVVNQYYMSLSGILEMFVVFFFHCNLLVAHDVSLSCYSCSLWLKALTVVPSRCLYCNNFFVVCVCFCFFLSNYTIENWKQCKSGLRFPPETWFCSSASTPFFQTMWTHSVVFNWVYCNLSLLLFILVLSLSQIWLSFWPVLSFSLFFEHSLLSGTVRCSRLI